MSDLITPEEVAKKLAISTQTLLLWRKKNFGPSFIKLDRAVRYSKEGLEEWIKLNTCTFEAKNCKQES